MLYIKKNYFYLCYQIKKTWSSFVYLHAIISCTNLLLDFFMNALLIMKTRTYNPIIYFY